eukprot:331951-Rhodomonas_salina.1
MSGRLTVNVLALDAVCGRLTGNVLAAADVGAVDAVVCRGGGHAEPARPARLPGLDARYIGGAVAGAVVAAPAPTCREAGHAHAGAGRGGGGEVAAGQPARP